MTLVTAGRAGIGKSTLTRNMLRLTDKEVPLCQHSPSSVTKEVKVYTSLREEVMVRIVDAPGLTESDVSDSKTLAGLQEKTGGKCDILLYCVSLLPDSKIDKKDEKIINKLTHVFGEDMWEHTILVLTFANAVKDLYPDHNVEDLVNDYTQKFQSVLQRVCPSFSVVSIFSCDRHQAQRDPSTIVALPVGSDPDEKFVAHLPAGWEVSIFLEVLKKRNVSRTPTVLKANYPVMHMPIFVRVPLLFGGLVIGTAIPTAIGAGTCVYIGTAIGRFVRQFVKNFDVSEAQKYGLLIGAAVFSPWAALQIIPNLQRYEVEQRELEDVQTEVKKYGSNETHS